MSEETTRDWLLKKLLKADRNIVEQQAKIESLSADLEARIHDLVNSRQARIEGERELLERIRQLSPEKQFDVRWNGPGRVSLEVDSISSCNGVTTISVRRA